MRGHPPSLRRASALLVAAAVLVVATLGLATGVSAAPTTPPPTSPAANSGTENLGPPTAGKAICTVKNSSLNEITGMVATDGAIYAVQGGDTQDPDSLMLWTINPKTCATTSANYQWNPIDPQDLAMGTDGA